MTHDSVPRDAALAGAAQEGPVLSAAGLTTGYPGVRISERLDVTIRPGSFTALVGANGSGKSTLLSTLARILDPVGGSVLLDGADARRMPRKAFARAVGMLPQHPTAPEGLTVAELVARGRYPHRGLFGGFSREDAAAVDSALAATSLVDLADTAIGELSGGQRQRVWIAMALAQAPRILMLDEPTSFLDLTHQLEVLELLAAERRQRGATVVTVLHDLNLAARFADTLLVMRAGAIIAEGPPVAVLTPTVLREAFSLEAIVVDDPLTGTPMVVPRPGSRHAPDPDYGARGLVADDQGRLQSAGGALPSGRSEAAEAAADAAGPSDFERRADRADVTRRAGSADAARRAGPADHGEQSPYAEPWARSYPATHPDPEARPGGSDSESARKG